MKYAKYVGGSIVQYHYYLQGESKDGGYDVGLEDFRKLKDVSCVRKMCHVSERCVRCQEDVSGVRKMSHVSGRCVMCQEDVSGVRKMCHVSGRCVRCLEDVSGV